MARAVSLVPAVAAAAAAAAAVVAVAVVPLAASAATAAPPAGAASCSGCHATAAGVNPLVPRLVGIDASELVRAMQEFRSGQRQATVMDRIAKGFTDAEIQSIAAWYAAQR